MPIPTHHHPANQRPVPRLVGPRKRAFAARILRHWRRYGYAPGIAGNLAGLYQLGAYNLPGGKRPNGWRRAALRYVVARWWLYHCHL